MLNKSSNTARWLALALALLAALAWNKGEKNSRTSPTGVLSQTGYTSPTLQPTYRPASRPTQAPLPTPTWPASPTPESVPTQVVAAPVEPTTMAPAEAQLAPNVIVAGAPAAAVQPSRLAEAQAIESQPAFTEFAQSVQDGQPGVVRGVYADGVLALRVIQQPQGQPLYVSEEMGIATQFQDATPYGVTGLLAHNFLAGDLFYRLTPGELMEVVYGDGQVARFVVADIQRYQKLEPSNPASSYIDVNSGATMSSNAVFDRVYSESGTLTLQTCLRQGDDWSWGLMFVIAEPLN